MWRQVRLLSALNQVTFGFFKFYDFTKPKLKSSHKIKVQSRLVAPNQITQIQVLKLYPFLISAVEQLLLCKYNPVRPPKKN